MSETDPLILHASAVAIDGQGVLITGPSGSGKSALAADLISRGAVLISDDRTSVSDGRPPSLSAPEAIRGLIELRGLGLVKLSETSSAPVALIVDLSIEPPERLPDWTFRPLLNWPVRLIFGKGLSGLAATVTLAATGEWIDPKQHKIE